jgi:hypothetical protein
MPHLRFEQDDQGGGKILDGPARVAEVRNLRLVQARCTPGNEPLFGTDIPVPLYWQQYAHHQDPERNAGSNGVVECLETRAGSVTLRCTGSNASGGIHSEYVLTVRRAEDSGRYEYQVKAALVVHPGAQWHVTPNPIHGEVEFLNLWPHLAFTVTHGERKRYTGCYVQRAGGVTRIPHHHLETSDKREILLGKHDRFLWLLEDENPVVEILSDGVVTAGVCAYMWDAHFGYRVCPDGKPYDVQEAERFQAEFLISSMSRETAAPIELISVKAASEDLDAIPIVVDGVQKFSESPLRSHRSEQNIWPWANEVLIGEGNDVTFTVDRRCGYDDDASLRIDAKSSVVARWLATTIGPAFGGHPFSPGHRYKLTAMIRCSDARCSASLGLRLHRADVGSVFDLQTYAEYHSDLAQSQEGEWRRCEVVTPAITPAPDRMHILLKHDGAGTTWFDNVLFEEIE